MKDPTNQPNKTTRRGFLNELVGTAAGLSVPWVLPTRMLSRGNAAAPSERITLGVIGIGPRCRYVLGSMLAEPDVQCVAICDVQASRREAGKTMVDSRYGNRDCRLYRDFRELLERRDIDAVLIATGDRWHAPASILAARAGKDIYCEKPCGLTIAACQDLAQTMQRYGRVFQAGTQRRSIGNFQLAVRLAHSGKLGRVHTLYASVYIPSIIYDWLPAEPEPTRDVVDWDMWLGPAPWRPYNRTYVNGGWRGHYDLDSGGRLLDWGAHTLDLCQWANNADNTTPVEFEPTPTSIVGRYANGVRVVLDFLRTPFGDRPGWHNHLGTCPVRFVGDEGWVETGDSGGVEVHPASLRSELRRLATTRRIVGTAVDTHVRDFFDCIKSRALTACPPQIMRRSHIACHAAATAWMLNRKLTFDPVTETFVNDAEANRLRSRAGREPWGL